MAGAIDHEPIDYTIGSMEISEQKATFNVVVALVKWTSLVLAALLLTLTLWFGTAWTWFPSVVTGVIVFVLGAWLLRKKTESDRPH